MLRIDWKETIKRLCQAGFTEKDKLLILSAQATGRQYYKKIELPCLVKDEFSSTYKNGILQVRIKK